MNPYATELFIGYEIFGLNYDLLVGYDQDTQPAPGYAASWTQDGTTWTFKIDPDLKWSDGTAATSEDARWTLQKLLDGQKADGYVGAGYLDPYLTYAGVTSVTAPDPADPGPRDLDAEHPDPDVLHPDPAQAHLGDARRSART